MDRIFRTFLENTAAEAAEIQARSDVVLINPLPPAPPSRYCCVFDLPYLCRRTDGTVDLHEAPVMCGIHLPDDYLRSTDPRLFLKVAAVLNLDFLHPNVLSGCVCLGAAFAPGTPITALVWELFDIVSYRNCTIEERNALDPEACRLVREYPSLLANLPRRSLFRKSRVRVAVRS
jgi:hypothetical protein